jgi:hypothetical protein
MWGPPPSAVPGRSPARINELGVRGPKGMAGVSQHHSGLFHHPCFLLKIRG